MTEGPISMLCAEWLMQKHHGQCKGVMYFPAEGRTRVARKCRCRCHRRDAEQAGERQTATVPT